MHRKNKISCEHTCGKLPIIHDCLVAYSREVSLSVASQQLVNELSNIVV